MTIADKIQNEYFECLYDLVCKDRYSKQISYRKLLSCLHNTEFTYILRRDRNRAEDGLNLRYRFVLRHRGDEESYLDGPCSVLEMMIALAIRCEESIMDNPAYGDRTKQWFWGMIVNMGLSSMTDDVFNRQYVEGEVKRLINSEYENDGKGGLFRIKDCDRDLRTVPIWYQLCSYLDEIV